MKLKYDARIEWVEYGKLSKTQKKFVKARYKAPYRGWLYRTYKGGVTMTGSDRRRKAK